MTTSAIISGDAEPGGGGGGAGAPSTSSPGGAGAQVLHARAPRGGAAASALRTSHLQMGLEVGARSGLWSDRPIGVTGRASA